MRLPTTLALLVVTAATPSLQGCWWLFGEDHSHHHEGEEPGHVRAQVLNPQSLPTDGLESYVLFETADGTGGLVDVAYEGDLTSEVTFHVEDAAAPAEAIVDGFARGQLVLFPVDVARNYDALIAGGDTAAVIQGITVDASVYFVTDVEAAQVATGLTLVDGVNVVSVAESADAAGVADGLYTVQIQAKAL